MNTKLKITELDLMVSKQEEVIGTLFKHAMNVKDELHDTKIKLAILSAKFDMLLKYQNLEIRDEPAKKYIAKKETK